MPYDAIVLSVKPLVIIFFLILEKSRHAFKDYAAEVDLEALINPPVWPAMLDQHVYHHA